jgi:hypothetical protein
VAQMAKILADGTVIESNLNVTTHDQLSKAAANYRSNNLSLKAGTITRVIYPNDKDNINGQVVEYSIDVLEKMSNEMTTVNTYSNCIASNSFGSINNKVNFTYQAADGEGTVGSRVLFLCINGISNGNANVIIGGLDPLVKGKKDIKAADGQFFDFNFNGINFAIDKDGAMQLTFNSFIDLKGNKANEKAAGTQVSISKEGQFTIADNEGQSFNLDRVNQKSTWTDGNEFITIDKKNKSIQISSSGKVDVVSTDKMSITSSDSIDQTSSKDYNVNSGSNLNITSKANSSIKADASMNIKSGAEMTVQSGSNMTVKASGIAQIKGELTKLGEGTMPVGIVGTSISIGYDSHGVPVVSTLTSGSNTVFSGT